MFVSPDLPAFTCMMRTGSDTFLSTAEGVNGSGRSAPKKRTPHIKEEKKKTVLDFRQIFKHAHTNDLQAP